MGLKTEKVGVDLQLGSFTVKSKTGLIFRVRGRWKKGADHSTLIAILISKGNLHKRYLSHKTSRSPHLPDSFSKFL